MSVHKILWCVVGIIYLWLSSNSAADYVAQLKCAPYPHWDEKSFAVLTLNIPKDTVGRQTLGAFLMSELMRRRIIGSEREKMHIFLYVHDVKNGIRSLSFDERQAFWVNVRSHNAAIGNEQNLNALPLELADLLQGYLLILQSGENNSKL